MSNNITPIRQYVSPQNAPTQQDWWYPPGTWPPQQGCPPPQVWPPQQGCPPPPCPQPPSCFSQVAKADACWDQSQALYNLVSKVVMDIFQTNPGIIPPPPPSAGSGPVKGVTDGSDAQPGFIGEHFLFVSPFSYAAYPTNTTLSLSLGVVQPGDWDLWSYCVCNTLIGGIAFYTNPPVTGASNWMAGQDVSIPTSTVGTSEYVWMNGQQARASFTVPTLIPFSVIVFQSESTGLPAGTGQMYLEGRRRR